MDIDAGPKVLGDDGQFHAADEAVDLSGTPVEAWAACSWPRSRTRRSRAFARST
jgi:hypothetical protein